MVEKREQTSLTNEIEPRISNLLDENRTVRSSFSLDYISSKAYYKTINTVLESATGEQWWRLSVRPRRQAHNEMPYPPCFVYN